MGEESGAAGHGMRRLRTALIAVGGLVAGAAIATAWSGLGDLGDSDEPDARLAGGGSDGGLSVPEVSEGVDLPDPNGPTPPGGAEDPEAAVRGFLSAEQQGDLATSFTYLSADDRSELRSAEGWEAAHADRMPPVRGFEVGEATVDGSRAEVETRVRFEPTLDEVVGLVPARARVTWSVIEGDGGWGVALGDSRTEPRYPDEAEVPDSARAWLDQLGADCDVDTDHGFVGSERVLEPVCSAMAERDGGTSAVELGEVTTLPDRASRPFVARYGGGAANWARVMRLAEPAEIGLVLAPIGDRWEVIGAVDDWQP